MPLPTFEEIIKKLKRKIKKIVDVFKWNIPIIIKFFINLF